MLVLMMSVLAAADGTAQERARWTDLVYRPGAAAPDSTTLVASVDVYSAPPRWRAEIRAVEGAAVAEEALILVDGGQGVVVLTPLGATPLAQHAGAETPLVRGVVGRFDASGQPLGARSGRLVERDPAGAVAWIVERLPALRPEFADALFQTGTAGRLARQVGRFGIQAVGGERRQEVVASAAARGVSRVRTVDGEITVTPDIAGIQALAMLDIGILELERFWREGGFLNAPGGGNTP
jgi:hypothetical protein